MSENYRLQGLCESHIKRIQTSAQKKRPFNKVAEQCMQFFNASVGFMWSDKFRSEFMGGAEAPRFRITVAKAFELVATFGPALFWQYPGRVIKSLAMPKIDPLMFGDPNDPQTQQLLQQFTMEQQVEGAQRNTRNSLLEIYLNYSQREQPGGGLKQESLYCINEALVKGRGCLWTEPYRFAGSERVLTGCFHDTVDNLFIDPDCMRPNLSDANWIARRHIEDYWKVERRFQLPEGYLKHHAKLNSDETFASGVDKDLFRCNGNTHDQVVWYELFSKAGVGHRMDRNVPTLHKAFDEVVGDHAYICFARGVPFPLNMPPKRFENASVDEVRAAFDWPVPYYKDGRWPVALLDLYPNINNPWPVAPMAMGLGELMFLNIMMSILADRAYENSRLILGVAKHAADDVRKKLQSGALREVIEFNADIGQSLRECVEVFQMPEFRGDILQAIDYISMSFDKRTGLSELLYGGNAGGTQSRTAADINIKAEMANVRPQYMAGRVEDWQTEAANLERICAGWNVRGSDLEPLLGRTVAPLWDQLISNEDPEVYVRQMRATVEANSIRKPNKVRDNQNLGQLSAFLIPELSKHADVTGDTTPLNALIAAQGAAMEQNTEMWMMGPRQPPPPPGPTPEEMAQQEAMMMEEEENKQRNLAREEMAMERDELELERMALDNAVAEDRALNPEAYENAV